MEQCLLDRRGKLHFYKGEDLFPISKHNEIAQTILPKADKPLDILMNQGWVIIGSHFKAPYSAKEPTQSQKNTLFDLNIKYVSDFYSNKVWTVF